jgi:hypothetical protein
MNSNTCSLLTVEGNLGSKKFNTSVKMCISPNYSSQKSFISSESLHCLTDFEIFTTFTCKRRIIQNRPRLEVTKATNIIHTKGPEKEENIEVGLIKYRPPIEKDAYDISVDIPPWAFFPLQSCSDKTTRKISNRNQVKTFT